MATRTRTLAPCPSCGAHELLSVSMTISEAAVLFASCNACEWKGWQRGGETLPLSSVLSLVTKR